MGDLIRLRCDVDSAVAQIRALDEQQLPYILARSLTAVAQEAQKAVRISEGQIFTTRNDWTVRNTKITPATKTTQTAEVYTDTANRSTGAPDYLVKQEDGGERVPVAGRHYLAIPTRYLWRVTPKNRPLPDGLRPAALLPPNARVGDFYQGSFTRGSRTAGTRRVIGRAAMKKLGTAEYIAFLQHTRGGTLCIFVRHGGIGYHGAGRDAEPWYTLVRGAHIPPRLHMQETVEETVRREFGEIFVAIARDVGISVPLK